MDERIDELESIARRLEPEAGARDEIMGAAHAYAQRFLEELPRLPGYVPDDNQAADALADPFGEAPRPVEGVLETLWEGVDRIGVNESGGHFFGFIPGASLYTGAVGDYLAAVTNRYAGVTYGAPGVVRLQQRLIEWFAGLVGYPAEAGGDLTSGGSVGNLTAIVLARERAGLDAAGYDRAVVYLTGLAHHSVTKALRVAGMASAVVRTIAIDDRYRMRPDALDDQIRRDRAARLDPWLVVASAGNTDAGAVDPLDEIADVTQGHDIHLHVDAAYGGGFALCPPGRAALRGIERSDSLVMDPHKALFIPFGTGLVLVKDRESMIRAHGFRAHYLQDTTTGSDLTSPADVSPELTRHNRVIRFWLPLALHGVAAFRAGVEEKMLLARYFHAEMSARGRFDVGPEPDLSVVTFRLKGGDDASNRALLERIHADGRIYLSSTMLDGRFTLRLAILSSRSHREHVDLALDVLHELAGAAG